MANLSSKTGSIVTPVLAQVSLTLAGTSSVQDFSAYLSQELWGYVTVSGSTNYRAWVKLVVNKNGAGTYEVASSDIAGDDYSGAPIVSFSMSGSILQATLPSISGATSANINYQLTAPYLGASYPLSVDGSQIVSGTVSASNLPTAGAAAAGIVSTGAQTIAGDKTFSGNIIGNASSGIYGASTAKPSRHPSGLRQQRSTFSSVNGDSNTNKDVAGIVLANYCSYIITIAIANDSSNYANTVVMVTRGAGGAGTGNVFVMAKHQAGGVNTGTIALTANGADTVIRIPMTNSIGTLTGIVDVVMLSNPTNAD